MSTAPSTGAAVPAILAACRALRADPLPEGLPAGQAVATTAGDLPARWVIHTVGPVYSKAEDRSAMLASCLPRVAAGRRGARRADRGLPRGVRRRYGWPLDDAARIAVETARAHDPVTVQEVRFVLFNQPAYDAFAAHL